MEETDGEVCTYSFKVTDRERLGGSVVEHLPSAQVVIPGFWDGAPHQAPCSAGSLLLLLSMPLPSFLLLVFALSFSVSNK